MTQVEGCEDAEISDVNLKPPISLKDHRLSWEEGGKGSLHLQRPQDVLPSEWGSSSCPHAPLLWAGHLNTPPL